MDILPKNRPPSLDERWAVFAALKPYPQAMDDIVEITDLPPIRVIHTLSRLGVDGLAHLHAIEANEWTLPHDVA